MQVVNKYTHTPTDVDVYIGRPSIFGNPFVIGRDGTREEVIEKYRHYLWDLRNRKGTVWDALIALDPDANLVCYCAPKACHGDILIRAFNWYNSQGGSSK